MKNIGILILALIWLSACGQNQSNEVTDEDHFVKNVQAAEFKALVEKGEGIILDVRTPEEIAKGYIDNASIVNLYDPDFVSKINLIDKSKEIYIYCHAGGRSAEAAKILRKNGFDKVYNLSTGIMDWNSNGYPLIQTEMYVDENILEFNMEDFKAVLATDKPVLVDFHTLWCAPCKKMVPVVDKLEKEMEDKAVVLRVDIDKSKALGDSYQVKAVPVFMVFKDGVEKWKHSGVISEAALKSAIEQFM